MLAVAVGGDIEFFALRILRKHLIARENKTT
jgi:hypothetical protein